MSYAITGVKTGIGANGALPLRQEIDTWSSDPANVDQVNLFLQALAAFQQVPPSEKLSYFQLAGVHGEPFVPWDENTRPNSRTRWRGYCTHASVLFPTWHRPYLAAYEQMLHQIMLQIVAAYPDQQLQTRYRTAANTFRVPYWDSAQLKTRGNRRSLNVPYLCTLPTVEVFTPTGQMQIDNPLYRFKFPPGSTGITSFQDQEGNFYPFATALGTSRYPPAYNSRNPTITRQWSEGTVNNERITAALRNLSSLGEDVYRSFTTNNYVWYASTQQSTPPAPDSYQSLESIHNEIHGITGGGGHMSWNTVSSFDPIFWLHHANVDRLFAIWQAIYSNSWFNSPASQLPDERGTWSIAAGTRETPQTPLAPFHKDERGGTYNSDEIRDWTIFGSSYPELQPWLPQYQTNGQFNPTLYRNDIIQQVTNLYSRVRGRVQQAATRPSGASLLAQNRLFAPSQSGPQGLTGRVTTASATAAGAEQAKIQNFPPGGANPVGQTNPPTQQFAPPPTQPLTAAPTSQVQQFSPPPTTQAQASSSGQKPSGLRGLMSSAQKHLGEAINASREASHGTSNKQPEATAKPAAKPASSTSALASKLGSVVGGGIHVAQERLASSHKKTPSGSKPRGPDDEPGAEGESLSRGMENMGVNEPITYHEYDCNIRFERFALGGRPFTVHIFIGDFNPDPATWMWDENRVGGVYNFVAGVQRGDDSACSNCEQQSEDHTIVTGQVSLTNALLDDVESNSSQLQSLIPEEVMPYLQRHLHWRITDPNGVDIPREQIQSLKISVVECSATLPINPGEFTQYGTPRVLDIVTEGRPGGKAANDGF